jgi:hypothetical protein
VINVTRLICERGEEVEGRAPAELRVLDLDPCDAMEERRKLQSEGWSVESVQL